ncbi:MAG: M48 family metallopeptidase [Candidatus Colwellbacteria bacterium]|nr:M48 family metallopeptidase [Candidatus Colwellbacteria bacterium]
MSKIELQNQTITYTLRKSKRAKRMRLAVYCDGTIVITTPHNFKETVAEKFIREKSEWLFSKIDFFKQFQGRPVARYSQEDYLKYKDQALALTKKRIEYFNKAHGFKFNKINIKNQKTRWGSCSRKGNLNFNYKIIFLPDRVQDYIVAHELCHLKEFNHSRKFWTLVSKLMPDYATIRNDLKKSGLAFY